MNALEFFADISRQKGEVDSGEEMIILLPSEDEELTYFRITNENGKHFYEYFMLKQKEDGRYQDFFSCFKNLLIDMSEEKQYEMLKELELIEVDYEPIENYDDLNEWYLHHATCDKYPLYSIRGICNREKECKEQSPYCAVHCTPVCSNRKVGCSHTSAVKNPEYTEFFIEFVLWMMVCPSMDVLYVMHDFPPVYYDDLELNYEFAFLLKDRKITYIDDKQEVERLYKEYHQKYPCDTSKVEDMMNSWHYDRPDFHF